MSPHRKHIEEFVGAVRRRTNRHRLWTTLLWAVAFGASVVIVVGVSYVARGYAVPGAWVGAIVVASLLLATLVWGMRRHGSEQAARFTDRFFHLHDSVTSYLHFAAHNHRDGYYALQAEQTAECVAELDATNIRYKTPRRLVCIAAVLVAVAIPLSICPPSDEVLERLALEEALGKQTAAINEELLKEADKLVDETADKEEEKLLEPDKLRRWVEELKATTDRTEALRQYAKLERKLDTVRQSLQRKEDEQLLERAAEELAKGEETKPLAEPLAQKEYDKAAEKLKDLKPDEAKSPDQQRRDLAKLKAAAQRMVAAAQAAHSGKSSKGKPAENATASKNQGQGGTGSASNNSNKSGGEPGDSSDGELSETIGELSDALEACEKSEACKKGVCEKVDKLADQLKKLAICRKCDCRLSKLCRKCGSCQSNMCCESPNAGGHKAGWGSNTARRDERDELIDNGQTTQIQGIKGSGPSLTAVEAADSGSGVASRQATARQRAFKHQFESFVQREDVPEAVRDGVKQYFEIIHEPDNGKSPKEDSQE